jgi:hypothetical protein
MDAQKRFFADREAMARSGLLGRWLAPARTPTFREAEIASMDALRSYVASENARGVGGSMMAGAFYPAAAGHFRRAPSHCRYPARDHHPDTRRGPGFHPNQRSGAAGPRGG